MLDLNSMIEFSHTYCIAICGLLVPMNVLASLQPIIFTVLRRPKQEINLMALVASLYAVMIILHVGSWFLVGVVRVQTFILLWFASCCLITNIWAVSHGSSMRTIIQIIQQFLAKLADNLTVQNREINPETK